MKRLAAGILAVFLLSSAAGAASYDPEYMEISGNTEQNQSAVLAASSNTAYPATMTVMLNGTQVKPVGYNIQGNNYYKLRDVAQILTDTTAQFNVSWDKHSRTMNLLTGSAYEPVGGELGAIPTENATATLSAEKINVNDSPASLTAYNVAGYNYFKLVDLANALHFSVNYEAATRTVLITTPQAEEPPKTDSIPMIDLEPSTPISPENNPSDQTEQPENTEQSQPPSVPEPSPEPLPSEALDGKLKIWIDPGHGGSDSGNTATSNIPFDDYWGVHHEGNTKIYEKDFNLAVSLILQEKLQNAGVEVRMTRTDDTTVTPNERQQLFSTEGRGYDMIFSVHHNGYHTSTPQGAEILIQIAYENGGPGKEFGELLKQEYDTIGKSWRRFVFARSNSDPTKDYYFVLRSAQQGNTLAFISEFCFMSNAEDQKWILSDNRLQEQAQAQYNAIMKFFETHPY